VGVGLEALDVVLGGCGLVVVVTGLAREGDVAASSGGAMEGFGAMLGLTAGGLETGRAGCEGLRAGAAGGEESTTGVEGTLVMRLSHLPDWQIRLPQHSIEEEQLEPEL
jgi:hypothetical protein